MPTHLSNQDIADILYEMAILYEIEGIKFKPRAYEKAAIAVESHEESVSNLFEQKGPAALREIPGVGAGIAAHLDELLRTGKFGEHERLKKKTPVQLAELMAVEGVGAKTIATLWKKLGVRNVSDLERVAREGKLRELPGFGEKSEQKILKGIEFLKASEGRFPIGVVYPVATTLVGEIQSFPEVARVMVAGSIRRFKETIGDIDILAVSENPSKTMDRFVHLPFVSHVYAHGETKSLVRLKSGIDADLRVVSAESWGAALNYFTGSKAYNVALRKRALKNGWKLNEYGLFKGQRMIAGKTEEEIYEVLGLSYIDPELREATGEIEASEKGELPALVRFGELKGDLQVQTNWTDGRHSIEEMAEAAMRAGLEYIVITDHTKALPMTGGLDEKKLVEQKAYIEEYNRKLAHAGKSFVVLSGAEVNILKDGTLDIDDETLSRLDVVGAAVHSHFSLNREEQTARVIRAMGNPNVDIIFHLTGRLIGKREPIQLDVDAVIEKARETKTVLEIDSYPDRLDLKDEHIRKCVQNGVKMSIDSDAHATAHFNHLQFGIAQARRGWASREAIVNSWPLKKMRTFLK